jgi:hypothetical protein
MGTGVGGGILSRIKVAGAWSWPRLCTAELNDAPNYKHASTPPPELVVPCFIRQRDKASSPIVIHIISQKIIMFGFEYHE